MLPMMDNKSLINWLQKQPSAKSYDYSDSCGCLLSQYFRSIGFPNARVSREFVSLSGADEDLDLRPLPRHWDYIAFGVGYSEYHTFGQALQRAEDILVNGQEEEAPKVRAFSFDRMVLSLRPTDLEQLVRVNQRDRTRERRFNNWFHLTDA